MNTRSYIHSRSGSRDGVALILVLAFIVLLTILVVSFIAYNRLNGLSTASYSKSIQAQEIAQGGLEDILNDLQTEIIAGSTTQNAGNSTYTPVYVPTTNWTAQPARLGYASGMYTNDVSSAYLPPTLVRVSRASQDGTATDFYPWGASPPSYYTAGMMTNRASAANSSTNSVNGRSISAARWNKIELLATNNTIPPPFATNTPDWVYVTRAGSRACVASDVLNMRPAPLSTTPPSTATASPVVGRYAYVVYDEGALLDVNVAGYLSNAGNAASGFSTNLVATPTVNNPAGIAQNLSSKSYLAYADLTQLPGLSGSQTAVIDPLIKWRNASVNLSTAATAGTNFYQMVFTNAKFGFTTFQSNGTGTDSPVLGRQDLINYFAKVDPNINSAAATYSQALPYLGTFSRALNAPSWHPTADSTSLPGYYGTSSNDGANTFNFLNVSPVTYKASAETSGTANRDIPNVRYLTAPGSPITHYNDDGTVYTYSPKAGDPLVQHRFSLARLAWFNNVDPTSGPSANVAAIQSCFGLTWGTVTETFPSSSATYPCWQYTGSTGSTVQSSIETLDQVASEHREPNFFELLKAGILSGSIGQTPGPLNAITTGTDGSENLNLDSYNAVKDKHILQIGANIIDQADSDSYPTAIYFHNPAEPTNPLAVDDLCLSFVFGDENLPYLTRVFSVMIGDPCDTTVTPQIPYIKFWTQPEIWNPHQPPSTGAALPKRPTNFRLQAFGKLHYTYGSSGNAVPTSGTGNPLAPAVPSVDYDDNTNPVNYHGPGPTLATTLATTTGYNCSLIYFTDLATAASPFYAHPCRLNLNLGITDTGTPSLNIAQSPYYVDTAGDYSTANWGGTYDGSNAAFIAFFAGEGQLPDLRTGGNPGPGRTGFIDYHANQDRPLYYFIEYQDPNNAALWRPYGYISRIATANTILAQTQILYGLNYGNPINGEATVGGTGENNGAWMELRVDPRTDRLGSSETQASQGIGGNTEWSLDPGLQAGLGLPTGFENYFPLRTYGFVYSPAFPVPRNFGPGVDTPYPHTGYWTQNITTAYLGANAFYVDPDGVVRPGDSYRRNYSNMYVKATDTGDGSPAYIASAQITPAATFPSVSHSIYTAPTGSADARREIILNRLFRSVGELGYTHRDLPFKTLDFFSSMSADAALLDLFSVTDEPSVTAGEVNPSNMPAAGMAAVFTGSTKMEFNTPPLAANYMTAVESLTAANAAGAQLAVQGPLGNRADIVTSLSDSIYNSIISANANYANKTYIEAPMRALSNVTNTRTWNLLIDIIAQSGQMSPTAATLNDFVVQGERRYWLHVAIDRYTGKIIDQQLETIYE